MKITAMPCKGKDLKPGDLFTTQGQTYWDLVVSCKGSGGPVGEKVYIRTPVPCPKTQEDVGIFKITIEGGA